MSVRRVIALTLVLGLLLPAVTASATVAAPAEDGNFAAKLPSFRPLAPCVAGASYDPACDVDHDGDVDIFDIQTTAGHWNQSGVWLSDNNHDHYGQTWTGADNPLALEGSFGSPSWAPLSLNNSIGAGLRVNTQGGSGVWVESALIHGVLVDSAGADGVFVCRAGNTGACTPSSQKNGVEIGSAENHGVRVSAAGADGLFVLSAGDDGVDVMGDNLAGYFLGAVQITGGCTGCRLATFGVNTGDRPLVPGDVVSLASLRESGVDSVPMLMKVQRAAGGDTVVGVVQGWAELVTEVEPRPGEVGRRLVPRDGAADPGQYVTIVYSGLAQVKASGPVAKGARLTAGDDGRARTLQTRTLDGMEVTEGAQPLGVALEVLDDGEGLIWVLVNVQ